jgi:hypothetical protein
MIITPHVAAITLVSTLVYLGLVILGEGGLAAFCSHRALLALAIALLGLSGVARYAGVFATEPEGQAWILSQRVAACFFLLPDQVVMASCGRRWFPPRPQTPA